MSKTKQKDNLSLRCLRCMGTRHSCSCLGVVALVTVVLFMLLGYYEIAMEIENRTNGTGVIHTEFLWWYYLTFCFFFFLESWKLKHEKRFGNYLCCSELSHGSCERSFMPITQSREKGGCICRQQDFDSFQLMETFFAQLDERLCFFIWTLCLGVGRSISIWLFEVRNIIFFCLLSVCSYIILTL